jgi:ABC-type oligopeptide transport system substrate-binding subunit
MQRKKKFLGVVLPTLLVLVSMIFMAAACGGNTPGGSTAKKAADDKQVLRIPIGTDDFGTVDPAYVQDTGEAQVVQAIFTGLVQFKNDGTIVDQLAASHSVSTDGLTYSFTLKPGLKFSNGDALTTTDIAWSIDRAIAKDTKSPVAGYLFLLKDYSKVHSGDMKTAVGDSIIVKDATHMDLIISQPAAYFLQTLTYPISYAINKKVVDKYGDKWTDHMEDGAGSGPFMASSYNHTKGIEVVSNPNYYGKQSSIKKIQFLISGTVDVTYKAYLSGQYDLAAIPAANLTEAKQRKDFHSAGSLIITYITMNYNAKPFDDLNVRKAFALAVNKDTIVSTIHNNAHQPTNHIVPEGMLGYTKDLKGPDGTDKTAGSADGAKAALTASTYKSTLPPIKLTYVTGSSTSDNRAAALQQMWKTALGIDVQLEGVTRAKLTELEGQTIGNDKPLQIWIDGWQADYPDPQDWLTIFFGKGADYNNQNYGQNTSSSAAAQVAVQDLMAKADVEQDQTKRLAMYSQAEQTLIGEHVAWIPILQAKQNQLQNPKLQGWSLNALGIEEPDSWDKIFFTE